MKNIEDIIRENRDFFDEEPARGHFDRFSTMLSLRSKKSEPKRSIVPYLLRAAVVTLLVTLSSLWIWDNYINPKNKRTTLSEVSPQYREVESYYVHQVSIMQGEIAGSNLISNPEQKEMLKKEMKSMDSVYVSLQKELKANPNDQRIISAMIEHYQTKVEVMNYIISQLKAIRNENQNMQSDEKVRL